MMACLWYYRRKHVHTWEGLGEGSGVWNPAGQWLSKRPRNYGATKQKFLFAIEDSRPLLPTTARQWTVCWCVGIFLKNFMNNWVIGNHFQDGDCQRGSLECVRFALFQRRHVRAGWYGSGRISMRFNLMTPLQSKTCRFAMLHLLQLWIVADFY